jgi:hypothetical protein
MVTPSETRDGITIGVYLGTADSETEMVAATASRGDWLLRTDRRDAYDRPEAWILAADDPASVDSWRHLVLPPQRLIVR